MSVKSFIVVTYHDHTPRLVQADNPREALNAFLKLGKVNSSHYGYSADLYVDVDVGAEDDWDFAVWHPWGATPQDYVKFALGDFE